MTAPSARPAGASGAARRSEPSSPAARRGDIAPRGRLPRFSRFAAGLLALLAAAVLLAPDVAHAQSTTIWSATLTAKDGTLLGNAQRGYIKDDFGTLNPNTFTVGGETVTVTELRVNTPDAGFSFFAFRASNWSGTYLLCLDDVSYSVNSGTFNSFDSPKAKSLGWSDGDTV